MTTKTLRKSELAQFTGSENWYRHGINRNVLYTDGAQHVAEHGGAYWLLDEIAIIQPYNKALLPPRNFKSGNSPYAPIEPVRLRATMVTATSSSPRKSSTPISRWMKSLCTSPTTSSTCQASIDQRQARAGILAGVGFSSCR